MPDYKNFVKNGWHPEGTTPKSDASQGTTHTLKSQVSKVAPKVSGLIKRNKSPPRPANASVPLSALRDPSSFAPPPRRVASATPSYAAETEAAEETGAQPPPRLPSRPSRTNTADEPSPPLPQRRDTGSAPTLPATYTRGRPPPPPRPSAGGDPPALPPRLPPRNKPSLPSLSQTPAAPAQSTLQSGLSNQLSSSPSLTSLSSKLRRPSSSSTTTTSPSYPPSHTPRLPVSPSPLSPPPGAPAEGTSWTQKQAALKTANQFHTDPTKVSLSDARSALLTADNFRQRHGEQVVAGVKVAGRLEEKYGVGRGGGGLTGGSSSQAGAGGGAGGSSVSAGGGGAVRGGGSSGGSAGSSAGAAVGLATTAGMLAKKKPPPPPPKRRGLGGAPMGGSSSDVPPPIPSSTRPNF